MNIQKSFSKNLSVILLLISLMLTSVVFSQNRKTHRFNGKFLNQISELTEQQRSNLRTMIKENFNNGLSRTEIRNKVFDALKGWGIQVPKKVKNRTFGKMRKKFKNSFSKLTREQRVELRKKMMKLWDSGATREKMHNTIKIMFKSWGYKLPNFKKDYPSMFKRLKMRTRFFDKLSKEQRKELRASMKFLWESGSTVKEIRSQIKAKLYKWGVEIPKPGK